LILEIVRLFVTLRVFSKILLYSIFNTFILKLNKSQTFRKLTFNFNRFFKENVVFLKSNLIKQNNKLLPNSISNLLFAVEFEEKARFNRINRFDSFLYNFIELNKKKANKLKKKHPSLERTIFNYRY
jgi:hypothetical protein